MADGDRGWNYAPDRGVPGPPGKVKPKPPQSHRAPPALPQTRAQDYPVSRPDQYEYTSGDYQGYDNGNNEYYNNEYNSYPPQGYEEEQPVIPTKPNLKRRPSEPAPYTPAKAAPGGMTRSPSGSNPFAMRVNAPSSTGDQPSADSAAMLAQAMSRGLGGRDRSASQSDPSIPRKPVKPPPPASVDTSVDSYDSGGEASRPPVRRGKAVPSPPSKQAPMSAPASLQPRNGRPVAGAIGPPPIPERGVTLERPITAPTRSPTITRQGSAEGLNESYENGGGQPGGKIARSNTLGNRDIARTLEAQMRGGRSGSVDSGPALPPVPGPPTSLPPTPPTSAGRRGIPSPMRPMPAQEDAPTSTGPVSYDRSGGGGGGRDRGESVSYNRTGDRGDSGSYDRSGGGDRRDYNRGGDRDGRDSGGAMAFPVAPNPPRSAGGGGGGTAMGPWTATEPAPSRSGGGGGGAQGPWVNAYAPTPGLYPGVGRPVTAYVSAEDMQAASEPESNPEDVARIIAQIRAEASVNSFATLVDTIYPPHRDPPPPTDDTPELSYDRELRENGRPTLKGASLNALIVLLSPAKSPDSELASTFFMLFRPYSPTVDVLNMFAERFRNPPESTAAAQNIVRIRVCSVLRYWLKQHAVDFRDRELARTMREFIANDFEIPGMAEQKALLQADLENVYMRSGEKRVNPYPLSSRPSACAWHQVSPIELGKQITVLDHSLLTQIPISEFFGNAFNKENKRERCPNLMRMIDHFNKLTQWVTTAIVKREDPKQRVLMLKHFIEVALELKILKNLNGMMMVLGGLTAIPVKRMKKTWEKLDSNHKRARVIYDDLKVTMSQDHSFACVREILDSATGPVVPFIGMYMSDLTFFEEGNPKLHPDGLINMYRMRGISRVLRKITAFQEERYKIQRDPTLEEFLMKHVEFMEEEELYEESRRIEPPPPSNS